MLTLLHYAGLVLAAVSSIWGTTRTLTVQQQGQKTLTPEGRKAVAFVLLGLALSIVSRTVGDNAAEAARHRQIQEELQRTRQIIIAGQPLTGLDLEWQFTNLGPELEAVLEAGSEADIDYHENAQIGMISGAHAADINRALQLYPFLRELCRRLKPRRAEDADALRPLDIDDSERDATSIPVPDGVSSRSVTPGNVLVLIPLDETRNSILSFGYVSPEVTWLDQPLTDVFQSRRVAAGVALCDDPDNSCPENRFCRTFLSRPELADGGSIVWSLDPTTLSNAIDQQYSIPLQAALPPSLDVAILFNFRNAPFEDGNLATSPAVSLWGEDGDDGPVDMVLPGQRFSASITLTPNRIPEAKRTYVLTKMTAQRIVDDYLEELDQSYSLLMRFEVQAAGK